MPYTQFRLQPDECPLNAAFVHPVSAERMIEMDGALQNEPPCSVYYDMPSLRQQERQQSETRREEL